MDKTIELMYNNFTEEENLAECTKKKNPEYNCMNERRKVIEGELKRRLCNDDIKLVLEYDSIINSLVSIELRECYAEGFKQGINFS